MDHPSFAVQVSTLQRFLLYVFHYMQKRHIFNAGNLYAEQDLGNMTQAELLQHINDHILMVIPSGISRADCLSALRPWH